MADIRCKSMNMDERKALVSRLVQQFKENESFYLSKDFVESEARSKFIDPLLEALGWDVKNEKGARHDKQEVITEDRVVIAGQVKHPDYTLCYGGERKIYIEAKQPSIDLKSNPEPALQVRRYAYTSKMPIAILTDFQEFAVYDTRIKPKANDTAATSRIEYLTYEQYVEHFEELYNRISWEAVDLGKFDTYWETNRDKKGTATVDNDILQLIEKWRVLLAEDIALHNEEIDEFNLTSSVQKIIDRILFIRICEDKEIEERGTLKKIAEAKSGVYETLKALFATANDKFNAGLFATDNYLDSLIVQDKTLAAIINALYFPECQYEFSVLPVEILGSIYERFLGKIIRFTRKTKSGHGVEIIEKPEVQKAGGVYYTPPYIVRYIVKQTIGKKIEGKTPEQLAKMHFVDPACGSGSFLVGAYQYLLDWHLNYYLENPEKFEKANKIYKDATTKEYKLSIEEKRNILLNNIFGVDIDAQAVEVTKLSLFLKLLENEGRSLSSTGQQSLFRASDLNAKILPSMMNNIKCGNSLIGSNYYEDKDLTLLGIQEQRKVNVFDWDKQFPQVFTEGGFDCVIGNPPYVNINTMPEYHEYFSKKYNEIHTGYNDLMYYFLYRGINLLNKDGLFGVITSNYFIGNEYAKKLRLFLNKKATGIINFKNARIFDEASVHTTLLFAQKNPKQNEIQIYTYQNDNAPNEVKLDENYTFSTLDRSSLQEIWLVADNNSTKIIEKIKNDSTLLDEIMIIEKGSSSGKNDVFTVTKVFAEEHSFEKDAYRKNIKNSDIQQYIFADRGNVVIYTDNKTNIKNFPNVYSYLQEHKKVLSARNEVVKGSYPWWRMERPREKCIFDANEKLVVPYRATRNRFAYDNKQFFNDGGDIRALVVKEDSPFNIKYLLALLNSTLLDWYFGFIGKAKGNSREYFNKPLAEIPIKNATTEQQDFYIKLADQMIAAKQQLADANSKGSLSVSDKNLLEQRIQILDTQINTAVYKLYGLTPEEIKIVEGK